MNKTITNRDDFFLAKVAGRDVDIKTLTPPVTSSVSEELMLEVADRIDNIEKGGGGSASSLVVHFTDGQEEDELVADKTIAEILESYESNTTITGRYEVDGLTMELPLTEVEEDDEHTYVTFALNIVNTKDNVIEKATIEYDGKDDMWSLSLKTVNLSSSGDTVIMNVSMGGAGGIVADYTAPEVWGIYTGASKREIVARVDRGGDYADLPLFLAGKDGDNYTIIFMSTFPEIDGSNTALGSWGLSWDNQYHQWEYVEPSVSIPSLPAVTQSDNGKVFRVKNGEWDASAPYKIVLEDEGGGAIGTSQSYSDILAAIKAKQGIVISYNDAEYTPTMIYMEPDGGAGGPGDDFKIQCVSIDYQSSTMTVFTIETIDNGGQKDLLCSNFDYTLTPSV